MKLLVSSLVFVIATSCFSRSEYAVVVRNNSGVPLTDVSVESTAFRPPVGYLDPGISAGEIEITDSVPMHATVKWRTPDGILHEVQVEVRSVIGSPFRGNINFDIEADNKVRVWGKPRLE